jgi:hypothetical protein
MGGVKEGTDFREAKTQKENRGRKHRYNGKVIV